MQKVAQLWDLFIQAEGSTYEKSVYYDVFLSQFISDMYNGKKVEEIVTFCNWSGAATLIGCELLSDVDHVCSQPGDGDDLEPLKEYLYTKGWKSLVVLFSLGQQSFSCSHELANLLISLYPVCLEVEDTGKDWNEKTKNKYLHLTSDTIDFCFTNGSLKSKISNSHSHLGPRRDPLKAHVNTINMRNRRHSRGHKSERISSETISSESANSSDDFDVIIKSNALKIKLDPMDFDYFTSIVRSDDESRLDSVLYEPKKGRKHMKKISPTDFIDDSVSDVMNSKVSPYELNMLIIQLLISLCRSESGFTLSTDNSYPVCSKSVKFAVENLCSIQFGSVSLQHLESHEAGDLKASLTILLSVSLDRVLGCPDFTTNVILTGILPMMMRVLEDSVSKLTSDFPVSDLTLDAKEIYDRDKQLEVVFGLVCCSITFLQSLLTQNSNVNHIRNFLELFKIFIESSCGKLVGTIIQTLTTFGNIDRAKKVIELLGRLISEVKKTRREIVSPHLSKRLKQRRCRYATESYHHLDLFGNVYNPSLMGNTCQLNCCVSSLFMIFVRLLKVKNTLSSDILNKLLKVMNLCGTCCCFTTKNLFQYLIEIIQDHPQRTRILVYKLLENTIYPEMGYYNFQNRAKVTCVICYKNNVDDMYDNTPKISNVDECSPRRGKDTQSDRISIQSEKSHQSDSSVLDLPVNGKLLLSLDLFHKLLQSNDFPLLLEITNHLLKCASKMSHKAKNIILFDIFFPTFLTSKESYASDNNDILVFRILSSLSIFSSLLNDAVFAEQFINLKGLAHVLELISIPTFSRHCCSVLEKTMVIAVLTPEADKYSFNVLRDAVDDANKLFFKFYDGNKELSVVSGGIPTAMGMKKKSAHEVFTSNEKNAAKKADVLQQLYTFWKTYANLTLISPILRKYFADESILKDCKNILQISLKELTHLASKCSVKAKLLKSHENSEGYYFTKLIEALLTFILSTTENDEQGLLERERIINHLSEVLLNNNLRNTDVRRLAEVLLKCSLVQPSEKHKAYHCRNSPKLPLLMFSSPTDDDCQEVEDLEVRINSDSSSLNEENYVTADEGYEADIELRESGTSHGDMYETNSSCSVSENNTLITCRDCSIEKLDSKTTHSIVHRKLCTLAIDLLIHLYQAFEEEPKKGGGRKSKCHKVKDNFLEKMEQLDKRKRQCFNKNSNAEHSSSDKEIECEKKIKKSESSLKTKSTNDLKTKESDDKSILGFVSIFQRLISLCQENTENCIILCHDGTILKLLNGFKKCLSERKERYSELQRVILDLMTILASNSISGKELAFYLGFFKMENPPVDHLLTPLINLISNYQMEPIYSLQFPSNVQENLKPHSSSDEISKDFQICEGVISSWCSATLSIPLESTANWSLWVQGFSASLWLKVERKGIKTKYQNLKMKGQYKASRKPSKAESHISNSSTLFSDCGIMSDIPNNEEPGLSSPVTSSRATVFQNHMHLFTVGNESLALECWASVCSDILVWRLSRVESRRGYEIIAETASENCISSGCWHFLAFNIKNFMQRKKPTIEVTLIVDGWNELKIPLPLNGLLLKKPRPSILLLGHRADSTSAIIYLSNFMLFAYPVFTKEKAIYLLGLGPNCTNLTECQIGKRLPNFTHVFSPRTVGGIITWDKIFNDQGGNLRDLQDKLFLTYSAANPYISNRYSSMAAFGSGLLFSGFRPGATEGLGAQRIPGQITPNMLSSVMIRKHEGFIPSVRLLGGSAVFLFLFARIVDISDCPQEQAKSLYLLLKLVQSDCDIFNEFIRNTHYKLLHKVFQSSKCASGLHFIKAMLDASCDKPIVQNNAGNFQVIQNSDAIIVNAFLISSILDSWKDWRCPRQQNDVLRIFFLALNGLLKDDHPNREFNVSRLNAVCVVDALMSFCKERLFYDNRNTLDDEVFYSLVELIRSLLGSPPNFSHIVAIMDCLVILHPVNATYVTHLRNSFYFILSAGQTFSNEGPVRFPPCSQENTDEVNPKFNATIRNRLENDNRKYRLEKLMRKNFTQPIDSAKLNEALKNIKLKQKSLRNTNDMYDPDSNRYSDDLTFDSGIAGSYREPFENVEERDEVIVKATDGSQQNLTSFFPSVSCSDMKLRISSQTSEEEKCGAIDQRNLENREEYGNQFILTEGLLLILRDTILVLPDNMAQQILNHVIKLEVLLVFANHRNNRIRSAVVKVISSYLQRCSAEEINKIIKIRYFHHLANQISLYPASLQLVEDCLQLITRCNVSIDDDIFINQFEVSSVGMACLPPLLALLPRSIHDVSLAHSLIVFLIKFFAKDSSSSRLLLENGLLETLVKSLVASAHINTESRNEDGGEITDPITSDIVYFFTFIINQALNSPGIQNMQSVTDIRLQLYYVYRLEKEGCGFNANCVRMIRDTLCKLFETGLDVIQDKIQKAQTLSKGRYFFSSVSGAHDEVDESERAKKLKMINKSDIKFSALANLKLSNPSGKEISRSELSERFKIFFISSIEFFIYAETVDGKYFLSKTELSFIYHLLPTMLQVLSSTLEKRSYIKRTPACGIYRAVRDILKSEISEFVVWLLSPRQFVKTRMYLINTLISGSISKDLILLLLQTHPQIEQKFSIFLWDLMYNTKLTNSDLRSCQELRELLLQWGAISPQAIGSSHDAWKMDCIMLAKESDKQIASWEKHMEVAVIRCITKHDGLVKSMTDEALSMTSVVVETQNVERKCVMEKMRSSHSENIQITSKWSEMISQLTHERAIWFFEKSYPVFWQLDPTEGPSRVRRRLSRCYLNIDSKYLLPSHRYKLDCENYPEPLAYLFENHQKNCPAMILTERLHCNEKIRTMSLAKVVTPSNEIPGELLIGETCIYFVADDRHKYLNTFGISNTVWPFEDVREIHNRRYQLQEKAIEIFLVNGKTYLIAFQTCKERDDTVTELLQCNLPNKQESDNLGNIMTLWREGLITNWDYLTQLNKMAGRTFNDLMQYPVFPFVLSDYQSPELDLTKKLIYRNFKKPMAIQEKRNEQHYINNYNELLNGLKQVALNKEPYHYGSHYSNSGTVLHFLVRLPPFTKMLLQYQDKNFDLPDRTFHSMQTTWRLASCDSTTDVKEMLPEFFFLPEFLMNSQGFNFGVRQNGEIVNDVDLPPWCKNDPRKFILVHRQALESDFVTENLPHWIDLVFGYKQTGKAAVEAINVFHPATYCGFDVESISDPVERTAWETMVKTYGQTPKQLLKNPHPLAVQSLVESSSTMTEFQIVRDVKGLKWGNYVGSPVEHEPTIVWRQRCNESKNLISLLPLETNDILVFSENSTPLIRYSKERGFNHVPAGFRVAIVSWGHSDSILRMWLKKELSPIPILDVPNLDPISVCQSAPECDQLWIGHKSGNISVYKFKFLNDRDIVEFYELPVLLQGHSSSVNEIHICREYSISVTAGGDGIIILWDLNSISYIRSIDLRPTQIKLLTVSNTLGDIASTSQSNKNEPNILSLYSINASFIGSVTVEETVTSVCFSSAPEGISINVIACGLSTGNIRLYSTWDLSPVREIYNNTICQSVIRVAYSTSSHLLYACYADATLVIWGSSQIKYNSKTPKLINLTSIG